ncbi:hypothetical protein L6452_14607 [Arctium lappa]|uniref:Uncharacterized protein n=1 Tax=Arctium lappa TaxID=4217 RepID=A0ACB9CLC6_ARCLA|nr:hypothetical protein L6452_14607 [Arctium lappa]
MLVVEVPSDLIVSYASNVPLLRRPPLTSVDQEISASKKSADGGKDTDVQSIQININFKAPSIHQCIKAFADAYYTLEDQLASLPDNRDSSSVSSSLKLLLLIIQAAL